MEKNKKELAAITEKYKKLVRENWKINNNADYELMKLSQINLKKELIEYPKNLDDNERQEIQEFIRNLLVDFDDFLKHV